MNRKLEDKYPSGSEWRRWDLHIHSPASCRGVSFSGWDGYITCLENAPPEVAAIGITDYASIEGYKKLLEYRSIGRVQNVDLVLPNIELRLTLRAKGGLSINIHILISPQAIDHVDQIEDALSRLTYEFNGTPYPCTRLGLTKLGKAILRTSSDEAAAYSEGNRQFKVDLSTLRDWLKRERWMRDNCLVVLPNSSSDGASGMSGDSSFSSIRDELYNLADIIFSADPNDRSYFLGQKADTAADLTKKYRGLKACIHGSDAHDDEHLFRPDGNRFCWIKSDPTFEGLRQIIFEPAERVAIAPSPPMLQDRARVMRSMEIIDSNECFNTEPLTFNSGLIAIIGQKGGGKSALAELAAYATGSWYTDEGKSFIDRAGNHLRGTTVRITWLDGSVTEGIIGSKAPGQSQVRYLSQRFVERLCSEDYAASELVEEIEKVIFVHLDPTETLNASSFKELRALRTQRFEVERYQIKTDIGRLLQEQVILSDSIDTLADKLHRLDLLAKERVSLHSQIPEATSDAEAILTADVTRIQEKITIVQGYIASAKQRLVKIETLRARTSSFAKEMQRFHREISSILLELGFSEEESNAFKASFAGDIEVILAAREGTLRDEIAERQDNSQPDAESETLQSLHSLLEEAQSKVTADSVVREKVDIIQKRLAAITSDEQRLNREIIHIQNVQTSRLIEIDGEIIKLYTEFFSTFDEEKKALASLYSPVSKRLQAGDAQEQKLEFVVKWNVDIARWMQRAQAIFDGRKTQPLGSVVEMEKYIRAKLEPAWISADKEQIREAICALINCFKSFGSRSYLRSAATMRDLFDWIFDVGHLELSYGLKYNDVPLEKLSPGSKGVVLLILYLGMDTTDNRPLIIDQPEENLDNESIYNLLASYFRRAKHTRQIIIVTHNPNLVINTDAEQIIVASSDRGDGALPKMTYISGSLENAEPEKPGIRQYVCRILEGGEPAFHRREQRYALNR